MSSTAEVLAFLHKRASNEARWTSEKLALDLDRMHINFYEGFLQGMECMLYYIEMQQSMLGLEPLPRDFDNF